jgi:DNA-binding transcriptional LysR family regulator
MDRFQEMRVFAAVVELGSFVKAAAAMGLSKQATSRLVSELEGRLGVRLLLRTTRKLSLTDEGHVFHAHCRDLLAALEAAESEVATRSGEASGVLRVNVPLSFGLLQLAPLWPAFMARHPRLTLDVTLNDRVVDLVADGYDMAIRIARLPSSSMVSRKLATTRVILCASPDYLARRGHPQRPEDLARHDALAYSLLSTGDTWEFDGPQGPTTVKVSPRLRTNSGDTCRVAALAGRGLIIQPSFLIAEDLRSGALVEVMPEYRCIELDVYAVYSSRKFLAPKVRHLIDYLVESFAAPDWPA